MKVFGTDIYLTGTLSIRANNLLSSENNPTCGATCFRIICGAASIKDANKKCEEVGLPEDTFDKDYTAVTGNKIECELASNGSIWIGRRWHTKREDYVSMEKLLEEEV